MPLKAKHTVEDINGVRCTIIEKGIQNERMQFLKGLLEFNKLETVVAEEKNENNDQICYAIGVTDIVFNPTIAVYEMNLKTPDGKRVSPAYWEQFTSEIIDEYWTYEQKNNI
ncbi:MAG: hypothetical protein KA807_09160 [Prolixibacteraceae bacterium]|nr:hypothetical protein [Prolixibacteraceae bacterium]